MRTRSILLALGAVVFAAMLPGCPEFDYETGVWACDDNVDCPNGQFCNTETDFCEPDEGGGGGSGSEARCVSECRVAKSGCPVVLPDTYCSGPCSGLLGSDCRQCVDDATDCSALADCEGLCDVAT